MENYENFNKKIEKALKIFPLLKLGVFLFLKYL